MIHKLVIKYDVGLIYGIRDPVYILNEYGLGEDVFVYLHPREMQIYWENKYHKIPEIELYSMKRVIIYMVKNLGNEDFETYKDSSDQALKNLTIFYHTWNIPQYSKRIEESKNLLKNLTISVLDMIY